MDVRLSTSYRSANFQKRLLSVCALLYPCSLLTISQFLLLKECMSVTTSRGFNRFFALRDFDDKEIEVIDIQTVCLIPMTRAIGLDQRVCTFIKAIQPRLRSGLPQGKSLARRSSSRSGIQNKLYTLPRRRRKYNTTKELYMTPVGGKKRHGDCLSPFSLPLFHQIFPCLHQASQAGSHPSIHPSIRSGQPARQQVFTSSSQLKRSYFLFLPFFPRPLSPSRPTFPR